ncbi:hypothetical protein MNBD_GAMMA21-445 [hydrothermal vent metagenome]|uniref:Uncharacterized protein n=1 Tax=hydrothermal vent metagenome TaxID=652676 RepID=A0A3B0ZZI2_9ZZZZ
MKFNLEKSSANIIQHYQPGEVEIRQPRPEISAETGHAIPKIMTKGFILTPTQLIEDWNANEQLLTVSDLKPVFDTHPDVILLGTGEKAIFPKHDVIHACYTCGAGIEIMNSAAACRTYNVLASEQRNVTLAMILV